MWWLLIPVLILSTMALISYKSGKELKEDIRIKIKERGDQKNALL